MKRALVVGINCYLNSNLGRLNTPANDANAVAQRLHEMGFDEIRGLPSPRGETGLWVDPGRDSKVSKDELENDIDWLFAIEDNSNIPEIALLFFAGHGLRYVKGSKSKGFLATSSANPKEFDSEKWGVSLVDFRQILEVSPVTQQIVILDCCHAGEVFNYKESSEIDPGNSEIVTRCLMSACAASQSAFEPIEGQGEHSYFTATLLEGLQQPELINTVTLSAYVKANFKYKLQNLRRNNSNSQDFYQDPDCRNRDGEILLIDPEAEPLPYTDIIETGFNPYKGLEAFQEADAPYFFGRSELTRDLVNLIHDKTFLAVSGSSGSGKSSVVRAGLIPELKKGSTFSETATWKIYEPFKPGDDPLASLAQVLVDENLSLEQVNAELALGAKGLQRLISQTKRPCVLVVDQFEQLFTQCPSEARKSFLDCLCGAIAANSSSPLTKGGWGGSPSLTKTDDAESSLRVVITIRDDFLGKCAEHPQLLKLINTNKTNKEIVGPMNEAELREAISKPIQEVGRWKIPSDLQIQMLKDVQASPGSLPLLQYVLQQMVDRLYKFGQRLTVESYDHIGGVQKALQTRAKEVYDSFTEEQQTIAKSIFLELTQLVESTTPTARQVRKSQLTDLPPSPKQVETVLDQLEAARLIVTRELQARGNKADKITVVDVAHESLMSNWEQLKQWVNENPEVKRQRDEIQAKAQDWEDKGKRREGLLRGLDLVEVELFEREHGETFPLSALAQEFVRKSIRHRRTTRIVSISAVLAVLTLVTGLWLNAQRQATIASLRAKAAQAQNLLTSPQPLEGVLLAIQATGESQGKLGQVMSSVQSSLLTSIQTLREQNRLRHQDSVTAVAISPDGQTIVSGSWDNTVRLWNRQGEQIGILRGHQSSVTAVAISPDGQTIVSGSWDKTVRLWNRQGEPIGVLRGHQDAVWDVAISADGQTIVSGSEDNTVRLWNRQGEPIGEPFRGHQDWVTAVAISPDGQTIVSGSWDKTVRLWNRQGEPIGEPFRGHQNSVEAVAFSPDGQMIVSGSYDKTLRLWPMGWKNWLQMGCNQLQYHPVLVAPETDVAREAGETCQKYAWNQTESAQFLVSQGNALAREGDIEGAVAKFKQAKKLDATLDLEPEAEAKRLAVPALVEAGKDFAGEGKYNEAVAKFQQALTLEPTIDLEPEAEAKRLAVPVLLVRGEQGVKDKKYKAAVEAYTFAQNIDATVEISAQTWNEICAFGSLRGAAAAVLEACEKAVTLEPGYVGNRGLAKALTGDNEGAIQDFQTFIQVSDNPGANRQVQGYINALRAGENPFTEAEIKRLLGE
ncbi:nSTAND1 domain-containing NTPase [Laspinema olomoucense]|uniref:nSTAND1 domain-containing NTPase n=1 Tax=Laspinema olomoucense TaxID=3231600 RepID=UPI0021BAA3AE|nr:caspase family protein [Laspinema sp. D3a]MCT7991090.1 caspase family protein [Laspinema sp. D3a]